MANSEYYVITHPQSLSLIVTMFYPDYREIASKKFTKFTNKFDFI